VLKCTIDPSGTLSDQGVPLGGVASLPSENDITLCALHGFIFATDNLSGLRGHVSDFFCRLSTGQESRKRTLYLDGGLTTIAIRRPCILNGIDSIARRPDLLDRSIILNPPVLRSGRLLETRLWPQFDKLHAEFLGALLDGVSAGLRNLPITILKDPPRMADFATWVSACESAMPWPTGEFMKAYKGARESGNETLLENDKFSAALLVYARGLPVGLPVIQSASDLHEKLNRKVPHWHRGKYWPETEDKLGGRLVLLGPAFAQLGIVITHLTRTKKGRLWEIVNEREPEPEEAKERAEALADLAAMEDAEDRSGNSQVPF
jgi:hypothetical protein